LKTATLFCIIWFDVACVKLIGFENDTGAENDTVLLGLEGTVPDEECPIPVLVPPPDRGCTHNPVAVPADVSVSILIFVC
jgi:hypothetical protein